MFCLSEKIIKTNDLGTTSVSPDVADKIEQSASARKVASLPP